MKQHITGDEMDRDLINTAELAPDESIEPLASSSTAVIEKVGTTDGAI